VSVYVEFIDLMADFAVCRPSYKYLVTLTTERLLQSFVFLISLRRICAFIPSVTNEDFDCF